MKPIKLIIILFFLFVSPHPHTMEKTLLLHAWVQRPVERASKHKHIIPNTTTYPFCQNAIGNSEQFDVKILFADQNTDELILTKHRQAIDDLKNTFKKNNIDIDIINYDSLLEGLDENINDKTMKDIKHIITSPTGLYNLKSIHKRYDGGLAKETIEFIKSIITSPKKLANFEPSLKELVNFEPLLQGLDENKNKKAMEVIKNYIYWLIALDASIDTLKILAGSCYKNIKGHEHTETAIIADFDVDIKPEDFKDNSKYDTGLTFHKNYFLPIGGYIGCDSILENAFMFSSGGEGINQSLKILTELATLKDDTHLDLTERGYKHAAYLKIIRTHIEDHLGNKEAQYHHDDLKFLRANFQHMDTLPDRLQKKYTNFPTFDHVRGGSWELNCDTEAEDTDELILKPGSYPIPKKHLSYLNNAICFPENYHYTQKVENFSGVERCKAIKEKYFNYYKKNEGYIEETIVGKISSLIFFTKPKIATHKPKGGLKNFITTIDTLHSQKLLDIDRFESELDNKVKRSTLKYKFFKILVDYIKKGIAFDISQHTKDSLVEFVKTTYPTL